MNDSPARRRRSVRPALAALALGAAAAAGLAAPHRAAAICLSSVTYQGVPYLGSVMPGDAVVGGAVGPGAIPACDDVVSFPPVPRPPAAPTIVTLHRVTGVAPRFAVATPGRGGTLFIPTTSTCRTRAMDAIVGCLHSRTARYLAGPSLIAPPSARAGAVIGLAVRVRNTARRGQPTPGLDALLQQRGADGAWRSLFHLVSAIGGGDPPAPVPVGGPGLAIPAIALVGGAARPVRLPDVAPGAYRVAKRVSLGSASRWLVADLTILAP